jgi:hypothetical protein
MKIQRKIIKGFRQFQDFDLDLTDPRTGRPLEKVCFIGRNTWLVNFSRLITAEPPKYGLMAAATIATVTAG